MSGSSSSGTLAEVLASRRRNSFVGRSHEMELFRSALVASRPPFSVLHLHGPGGIGKTSLLRAFAEVASTAGTPVIELDGRDVDPSPTAVLAALGAGVGMTFDEDVVEELCGLGRFVLLIDSAERLAPLDEWLRTRLLPAMPATALTVLAGRTPPGPAWRGDAAWTGLQRVRPLRNLGRGESQEYLERRGIDSALHERLFTLTYGHPLGLSLMAEITAGGGGDEALDPLAPDLVGSLLRRFLDMVPDAMHRRALEVCALARVTTEPLLRAGLGVEDASELFEWLRGLSFVESRHDGLSPHDLARDALVADLRWRDRDSYESLFRGISGHIIERLKATQGREQQRVLFDAKYLHRYQPVSRAMSDWESLGQHYPERAAAQDRDALLDLARQWEGPTSAALVAHWYERQPDRFFVVRHHDGSVRGFLASLELARATPDDIAADLGCRAAWDYAQRHGPPRPGEVLTVTRFIVDRDAYQRPSPTVNCGPILSIQEWLSTPNLSWSFVVVADPELWDDFFPFFDLNRAQGADFEFAGRRYGMFGHDFRRMPVDAWLTLMFERDMSGAFEASGPDAEPPALVVLSESEFGDAVRRALRDLGRADLLARNPLVRSRLVHARATAKSGTDGLSTVVREAAERLRSHPRDEKLFRAVDRTFLRPAGTQEKAAEVLDLPFSTYRRHLAHGIDRIVADLWSQELSTSHLV